MVCVFGNLDLHRQIQFVGKWVGRVGKAGGGADEVGEWSDVGWKVGVRAGTNIC